MTQAHLQNSLCQRCMFKQGTKSIFTIILKDIWAQPGSKDNTWWITISETRGSKTFQIINCSQSTGCQRQFNPYYKQPDLSNAIPTFCAVFSTANLCTAIIQFLSLNELSLAWALSACLPPVFVPLALTDSCWTALSKTFWSSPHRKSSQERHISDCQASFWYSVESEWTLWCQKLAEQNWCGSFGKKKKKNL